MGKLAESSGIQLKRGVYIKPMVNSSKSVGKKENECQHHFNTYDNEEGCFNEER